MSGGTGPRAKRWVFTLNNYITTEVPEPVLDKKKYLIFGEEEAPTTGEPHLQGYAVFNDRMRLSQLRKLVKDTEWEWTHWEVARGSTEDSYRYCTKDNKYHEYGERPETDEDGTLHVHPRIDWAQVWTLAREGGVPAVANVWPEAAVRHFGQISSIRDAALKEAKPKARPLEDVCGVWVYGLRGCGKSTFGNMISESLYKRIIDDTFWSAYDDEEVILYDDVDHDALKVKLFTQELKYVSDKWTFAKRDLHKKQRELRPKACVVTSQYTIQSLWRGDTESKEALERRFWTVHITRDNGRVYTVTSPSKEDGIQEVKTFNELDGALQFLRTKLNLTVGETSSSCGEAKRSRESKE